MDLFRAPVNPALSMMARSLKPGRGMRALTILSVVFTAGIGVGFYLPVSPRAAVVALVTAAVAVYGSIRVQRFTTLALIATAFACGWVRSPADKEDSDQLPLPPCHRLVQGRVASPPTGLEERTRLLLDLEGWSPCLATPEVDGMTAMQGRLIVTIPGNEPMRFRLGDRVRLRAKIKSVVLPANPGVGVHPLTNPVFTAFVPSAGAIALVEVGAWNPRHYFDDLRRHRAAFWHRVLEPAEANMARALTLGETGVLDHGARQRFRRTGTAHLLSVSGLHLGLVVIFTYWIVRLLLIRITPLAQRTDVGRIAAACAVPAAVSFALLAGCRIPVVRAAVMATSALGARVSSRSGGTLEAMAVAAIALLAWDPKSLFDPGFQLSFAAVIGFVATLPTDREEDWLPIVPPPLSKPALVHRYGMFLVAFVRVLFRSSLAAAAATTPIVLAHFGYVSLVAVPANVVAVPLASFLIMPGLLTATLFAGSFPVIAGWIGKLTGGVLGALSALLETLSYLPCTLENPGPLMRCAVVAGSAGILCYLAQKVRAASGCAIAAVVFCTAAWFIDPAPFPSGKLTVDFLDVGQGDATLITFPNGAHWLVDSGGSTSPWYDVGERIVVPVLRSLGVRRIDTLILTHPDRDHVGGAPALLKAVEVGEIWENGQGEAEGADVTYHRALRMARARGIPIKRTPVICEVVTFSGVRTSVLHPCSGGRPYDPTDSFNDNSLVLQLRYGLVTVLLPGDIERKAERILAEGGRLSPVDVLKLPHHGSRTSSSAGFLDTTMPRIAVASLGLFNPYGIPDLSVLQRLRERKTTLLRTDRRGAVRCVTDGRQIEIRALKKWH